MPVLSMRNEVGSSKELTLQQSFVKTDTLLPRLEPDTPISDRSLWERYVLHNLLLTTFRFFRNKKFQAKLSYFEDKKKRQINICFVIAGLNPESIPTAPPNPTASQPFLTIQGIHITFLPDKTGLPLRVPDSNFAQICLV